MSVCVSKRVALGVEDGEIRLHIAVVLMHVKDNPVALDHDAVDTTGTVLHPERSLANGSA